MGKRRSRCGLPLSKDFLIQILVRLPVASLLQFKSVCKSWLALIESSVFADLYATFNSPSSSSKFGSFALLASAVKFSPKKCSMEHSLCMVSYGSGSVFRSGSGSGSAWSKPDDKLDVNFGGSSAEDQQLVLDGFPVPFRYKTRSFFRETVGSCDGLLCLYDRVSNLVSLWNPVTKKHRFLPKPIKLSDDWPLHLAAFGFDVKTRDYKVVLLSCFRSEHWRTVSPVECLCRVQVYSLSTDSWRLLEGITHLPGYPFLYMGEVLHLNGSCFFMAKFFHTKQHGCFPENDRFVISFDLSKESITTIQLPDHHQDEELYLSYLGDKIALFIRSYHNGNCDNEVYNIWVLNERSCCCCSVNKESWKKLSSFEMECKTPGVRSIPRGISNDAEFALLEVEGSTKSSMKLYNLDTKEVKLEFLFCSEVMSKAIPYKPSLVSIIGGNGSSSSGSSGGGGR